MPRTVVPEQQKRAADIAELKSIYPTDNRVVDVISDPDGQYSPYYWNPNGEASNADGVDIIESNITEFADGGANEGTWVKGRRDLTILDSLVPDGAELQDIDGTQGSDAKIGVADASTTENELFDTSGDRNGVVGPSSVTISGDLNPTVSSSDNYQADSFDEAETGTLKLVVNGSDLVTIDLTSTSNSITNSTANGSQLSVSASSPLTFANGDTYNDNYQRTGSYQVDQADLTSGTNTVKVRHEDGTGTLIGESESLEYFLDDDTGNITFASEGFSNLSLDPTKQLSGVAYHTGGTFDYSVTASGVYQNTYAEGNAIDFNTTNATISSISVPELGSTETPPKDIGVSETATISGQRIISESATVSTTVQDDIDTNAPFTSGGVTDFDLLIDQVTSGNAALDHNFDDENYRLAPSQNYDTDLGTGAYDSTQTLTDGNAPYDTQLQVTEGKVVYPSVDYSTITNGPANPNYSGTNTTGGRTYYGVFTDSLAVSNFVLFINGTGTLVNDGTASSSTDEVGVAIKAPSQTGWMDINQNFTPGQTADGNGAYQETNADNPSQTIGANSEIGVTIGTNSTSDSFNKLYYRITVGQDFTGEITNFSVDWGAN